MSLAEADLQQGYSIKETAERTGMSEDTIRYYEKIGLLPRAKRKGNSHRIYSDLDLNRMLLVTCLKKQECRWTTCGPIWICLWMQTCLSILSST